MLQLLNSTPVTISFCLLFLLVGLYLLRKGLRPRRYGSVPQCEGCGYNLTALQSDKCPECGADLHEHWATFETKEKRPVLIVLGCLLLVPSLILALGFVGQIEWDKDAPGGWLIADLDYHDPAHSITIFQELEARYRAGDLTASQRSQLIDACLVAQRSFDFSNRHRAPSGYEVNCVNHLGISQSAGQMSKKQEMTFWQQIIKAEIRVLPSANTGEPIPFEITGEVIIPSSPCWVSIEDVWLSVDGKKTDRIVQLGEGVDIDFLLNHSFSGFEGFDISDNTAICSTPGRHTFTATFHVSVYSGPQGEIDASVLLHQSVIEASVEQEVVEEGSHAGRPSNEDPAVKDALQEKIGYSHFRYNLIEPPTICGFVEFKPLPVNVAFDAYVRFDGKEEKIGECVVQKNLPYDEYGVEICWKCGCWSIKSFDIVLRSMGELELFKRRIDDVWEGEIVIEDVQLSED